MAEEEYSEDYVLQELSDEEIPDLESSVKLPYIMKDKVLMSPGVWNSYYYSSDAINDAFLNTEWSSKENRSLFLDHMDDRSSEWIGEVANIRKNGDDIIGDLVFLDKSTAIKLHYGAKMGISPKVHGPAECNAMQSFVFDNFSVVINPAVKTAWINNSQRVVSLDELGEFMDLYKSFMEVENMSDKLSDYTDFVKKFIKGHPDLPIQEAIKDAAKEWKKSKGGKKMSDEQIPAPVEPQVEIKLSDIKTMLEKVLFEIEELKKKEYKYPEKCMEEELAKKKKEEEEEMAKKKKYEEEEMAKKKYGEEEMAKKKKEEEEEMAKKKKEYPYPEEYKKMSEEIVQLKEEIKKLNEPNKISVKQELTSSDHDLDMIGFLRTI